MQTLLITISRGKNYLSACTESSICVAETGVEQNLGLRFHKLPKVASRSLDLMPIGNPVQYGALRLKL